MCVCVWVCVCVCVCILLDLIQPSHLLPRSCILQGQHDMKQTESYTGLLVNGVSSGFKLWIVLLWKSLSMKVKDTYLFYFFIHSEEENRLIDTFPLDINAKYM